MSTEAQRAANHANAQHSTGPTSEAGKAASCMNNFRHGFTGEFTILSTEDPNDFQSLVLGLKSEHKPATLTEQILVERMAQHHWLSQRAIQLQNITILTPEDDQPARERRFALFIRYQSTNERAFHKCLNDLLKLRAEMRKAEIGFESQQHKQAEEARRQNNEIRKQDVHKFKVWLAEGEAEHRQLLNARLETPETRVPGRLERIQAHLQAA